MRGDINVRMRRNGAIVIRARAAKVYLGGAQARPQPEGWVETQFGPYTAAAPSLIEMRSRVGTVSFGIME